MTGYTSVIEEDCDFKTFALRCARAFGPLSFMRNAPMDAPIPDTIQNTTSEYHIKQLAAALENFNSWNALSISQKTAASKRAIKEKISYHQQ